MRPEKATTDGGAKDIFARVDPRLAVVTVSFHSSDALSDLVDSIANSSVVPATTVVVNNAVDDSPRVAAPLEGLALKEAGSNLGYGGGINLGAHELGPEVEWILITNPDVRLDTGALATLLEIGRSEPSAGALGPRILEANGELYPSARELPSLRTGIGHALFANTWKANPWTRRYRGENRTTTDNWREAGWLSGSCLLVRRAAFDAIGGFDDSYFMYFEDVDLGARLMQAGWRNLYVPASTVTHTGAHSTSGAVAASMRAEHHRSAYLYLSRRYAAAYLWPLRITLKLALAVRSRVTSRG